MGWNFRVVKRIKNHKYLHEPEELYEIREVFSDENGDISNISEMPYITANNLNDLKSILDTMTRSCEKPVIDYNTGERADVHKK